MIQEQRQQDTAVHVKELNNLAVDSRFTRMRVLVREAMGVYCGSF